MRLKYLAKITQLVFILIAFLSIAFLVSLKSVEAAIRDTITYQGQVVDSSLIPPDNGNYNMQFRIYDSLAAGNLLWTESFTGGNQVTINDGVFTVELNSVCASWTGACASSGGIDWTTDSYFLQVEFDADSNATYEEIFAPRKRFTSVPYAQVAAQLNTASDIDFNNNVNHSIQWNETTDKTLTIENDDGTAVANLSVEGQTQVGNFAVAPTALGNGSMYYNTTDDKFYLRENGVWVVVATGDIESDAIQDADSDTQILVEEGADDDTIRFDIGDASGTAYPDALLINGTNGLIWNDAGGSLDFRLEGDTDDNLFFVDGSSDMVGIGTNTPGSLLEVNGGDIWLFDNGNDPRFVIGDTGISGNYGLLQWDSANDYFRIEKDGVNGMKINDNYVSIGNLYPDQPLKVANGSTELFRINTSGQVGINTSTLTASFEITPSDANAFRINPYGVVAGNTGIMQFMELVANGSNYVGFKSPDALASDVILTLPIDDGDVNEFLMTDGNGLLSWEEISNDELWDADSDTGIQVEEGGDDDTIRFDLGTSASDALLLSQALGFVWNDSGLATMDFRVEGDAKDELLFVDAGEDKVGIGTTAPLTALFSVGQGGHESASFSVNGDSSYNHIMNVRDEDGENIFQFDGSVANNDLILKFGDMDGAGNENYFTIDSGNEAFVFNNGDVTFNEAGGDYDFRVEGDTDENLLFVDASADMIGVGTNLPQYAFDLNYDPAASNTPLARLSNNNNSANPYALTLNNNYNQDIGLSLQNQGTMKWLIYNDGPTLLAEDDLVFESASGRAMTIEQNAYVAIGTADANENLVVGEDLGTDYSGNRITIANSTGLSGLNFGENGNNRAWTLWDNSNNYLTLGTMVAASPYVDTLVLRDGNVGVGTNDPNSTFQNTGSFSRKTNSISSNYTVTEDDNVVFIDASSGDVTVTLPTTSGITGREYIFKAMDVTNDIFLKAATGENIDGTNQYLMQNENDVVGVVNDGSNWMIAYYKSGEEFSDIEIGDGADGSQTVSASGTVLNTYTYLTGNETASSTTITVNSAAGFAAGDEILIHQSQDNANANEGVYEFAEIQSILGNVITLDSGISNAYFSGTFNALAAEVTQVVRVPNYTDVTIQSGASITALDWNGYRGGIVAFRANGTINFATGNAGIDVAGLGFRGGDDNGGTDSDPGDPGEGFAGLGWNNDATIANCNANENGGGGGYGPSGFGGTAGGGGGNRATGGDATDSSAPPAIAQGGDAVGDSNLSTIFLGGGGGGGGDNDSVAPPAYGGDGGGIVIAFAKKITKALVDATGNDGADGGSTSAGDGGGGAGGTVWLNAFSFTTDNIDISGGTGGTDGADFGGDGGEGWYVNGSSAAASSAGAEGFYFGIDATGGTDCNGPCQVPWSSDSRLDTEYYTHSTSVNSSQVTVKKSGWYKISYTVTFDNNGDGNNDRVTMRCRLRRDGSTYVNGSSARIYMRDYLYGEYGSITNTSLVRINANSYIEVECDRTSGSTGGTDIIANEASILIEMPN